MVNFWDVKVTPLSNPKQLILHLKQFVHGLAILVRTTRITIVVGDGKIKSKSGNIWPAAGKLGQPGIREGIAARGSRRQSVNVYKRLNIDPKGQ